MMKRLGMCLLPAALMMASAVTSPAQPGLPPGSAPIQPNAQQTRDGLRWVLQRYPRQVWEVLSIDPSLLNNQSYIAPYPDLVNFLNAHPEIAHSPTFYLGEPFNQAADRESERENTWRDAIQGFEFLLGFVAAMVLITVLLRAVMNHRRWARLNKVQTEVHSRLMERLSGNEELLAYIQSPAGSKFLESAPIALDAGQASPAAPLGRILWTVQAGVVLAAAGFGLLMVAGKVTDEATRPLHAFGTLGLALGVGFVISAIISFLISRRLGLVELPGRPRA